MRAIACQGVPEAAWCLAALPDCKDDSVAYCRHAKIGSDQPHYCAADKSIACWDSPEACAVQCAEVVSMQAAAEPRPDPWAPLWPPRAVYISEYGSHRR
jgi:hypothetical protein